jgi:DNA-3-methyladenine glycosylase II
VEPGDDEPGRQALFRPVEITGNLESESLDPAEESGYQFLMECGDPVMAALVRRIGPLDHDSRRRGRPGDAYGSLVRTIVGQQLSTKAARTIYGRLVALFGDEPPTPEEILSADEDDLRAVGLSRQKIRYLRDLARHVLDGELELDRLDELSDEEVAREVTAVKGLGRWSADMFLMFHLGRPDVLPVGDLGIRRAVERAYDLPGLPDEDALRSIAGPWRPFRTLACLYLWASLDTDNAQAL